MSARQPNLLFVYADQHRADVMGCAGNDIVVTPHLDRLATEGVRFDQTWTESPICQPARASLLTGRYPNNHGVLGNFAGDCQPEWDTFPRHLQQAGYTTASIGKTHFSAWPMAAEPGTPAPTDEWIGSFGFDHVVEEFDKYVHLFDVETPYMQFLREHDALEPYQEIVQANFRGGDRHWNGVTSPLPQELDLTCFLADEAQQWLDRRPDDVPWFLQLSFVQPHVPLMGDPVWADHYAKAAIERTARSEPTATTDEWATHLNGLRNHSHSELLTDEFVLAGARQYYAMVSLIDQRIGDLLAQLEKKGQLDNTWIVYSADHGEMLGDHGLMAKMNFYRSSVRVPLIVRPPGGTTGRVETKPVQAFDVAATLLDAGTATALDGAPSRSLVTLVTGGEGTARHHAVSMIRLLPKLPTWQAITDGQWRATFNADTGELSELFDLVADPDEVTNRASDPSAGDESVRLRGLLASTLDPA
ncbi:MAG: sulfatase-like hydrolase/transferase [Actinomycetota bacterium]|nr:sulfatase-like hydrolase/transferase [Actinomycetota bacterium]